LLQSKTLLPSPRGGFPGLSVFEHGSDNDIHEPHNARQYTINNCVVLGGSRAGRWVFRCESQPQAPIDNRGCDEDPPNPQVYATPCRPAWLLCGTSSLPGCSSALENSMVDKTPQWLKESNCENGQTEFGVRIREQVCLRGSLSNDPNPHSHRHHIHEISEYLTKSVEPEYNRRLDV